MRSYSETLDYLFSQLPMYQRQGKAAYKANLDNTHELDRYFGHPHRKFKTIHIAGTNGKGSVSHMLASVLQRAGYKTGLYTSPHLADFRERIRIDGEMISEENVINFIDKHSEIFSKVKPSFFEMTVAMAFDFFANEEVDIAVIETGMGGRLDSTNIVTPELSIITNIGLDHTQFLGDTIALVAKEKAGIIKSDIPVIIGEWNSESASVFEETAKSVGTTIQFADRCYKAIHKSIDMNHQTLDISKDNDIIIEDLKLDLKGEYQQKNILTALSATDALINKGYDISEEQIRAGLANVTANTGLKGRWQILDQEPLTICDTGHNTEGVTYIVNQLKNYSYNKLHMVIGMVNDKSIANVLNLLPKDAEYYFTKASIPRALCEKELKKTAMLCGLNGNSYESVEKAVFEAKKNASANDLIFIGGSTFVVAEIV
ncbi:MAG: bifunctional folylpolyglutamate synthase/dihydrofolate synthase [Bacteroidales bacterium]|nr:bifunctional folylpolyglutamate synthase/dihydrofolate synthase [Bacteroidales bacterium]